MAKIKRVDRRAFESCFETMPERRNAHEKYKAKIAAEKKERTAAAVAREDKKDNADREKVAKEKREREILEKKRGEKRRIKNLRVHQDRDEALKAFETLLAEAVKSVDGVENLQDVRKLLLDDPLRRADPRGALSENDMQAAFDAFLKNFKATVKQRYEQLCKETVSALSLSVGGNQSEEDEVLAWDVAKDAMKEDVCFQRCPVAFRKTIFAAAVDAFKLAKEAAS